MIFINVTGHITEQRDCRTDIEAEIYLHELKERHYAAIRPCVMQMRQRPGPYYYNVQSRTPNDHNDMYYTSYRYQQDLRPKTSQFPLKVEISHYEDMGDLV